MRNSPDILIIGSGVAGAAIAHKILSKNPNASVLMLEAGPAVKMRDFAIHQDYLITGKLPYEFCEDEAYPTKDNAGENQNLGNTVIPMKGSRLMMYGGSTTHWGGWSFRLKPEDFRLKTNMHRAMDSLQGEYDIIDWPISYDELEPYYCGAEKYIGVAGDSEHNKPPRSKAYPYPAFPYTLEDKPVINALKSLNIDYNHLPIARHGISDDTEKHAPCQTTGTCKYCPFGARFVAANYLDEMLQYNTYPNFEVEQNVIVEALLMSAKNTVAGVQYIHRGESTSELKTLTAKHVIVTAGAIESSKLLLRSTNQYWPNGIGNDNDLVGRNLITHPYIMFEADLPENPENLMAEMDFPTLVSRFYDSQAEQAKGKFIIVNPSSSTGVKLAKAMQQGTPVAQIEELASGKTTVQLHVLLEIFSQQRNRLFNANATNHLGLKETAVDFNQGPDFDRRIGEVKALIDNIFGAMGAVNTRIKSISWRADHAACTTRMSASADSGTVDKNLKVFGVDNLYICSNAAFSSLGSVNPTLTLTSLALRLGDHLNHKVLAKTSAQLASSRPQTAQTEPSCAQ